MADGRVPAARIAVDEPTASGRFETKIATSRPTLTPSAGGDADPEHGLLRDPVQERAERERGAGVLAAVSAPGATAAACEQSVEREVGDRAGRESHRQHAGVAELRALLREVEAHGADQRPRAEGEHEPDDPVRPGPGQPEQRADDQRRRGERAPAERGGHAAAPP